MESRSGPLATTTTTTMMMMMMMIIIIIACIAATIKADSSPSPSPSPDDEAASLRSALMSSGLELEVMYRYSDEFLGSAASRFAGGGDGDEDDFGTMHTRWWPACDGRAKAGSTRFLERLLAHDHRRRRHLLASSSNSSSSAVVSLSPTNRTVELSSLGGLHYAIVSIGTPPKQFLVALDTGSDLLWVPCQCKACATPDWSKYGIQGLPEFAIYDPQASNTSKTVACDDAVCTDTITRCVGVGACSYNVTYLSANTSTAGYIVRDNLLLNVEGSSGASIQTPIYFGCGQVQTGLFLDVAPNGLFGLGPEVYSVPTTLAASSVIPTQVFSMCFSDTTTRGRLIFGSKPPANAPQTPLIPITPSVFYVVKVAGFNVGTSNLSVGGLPVIFDTGTSITILIPSAVKIIGDKVSASLGLRQTVIQLQPGFQLSYCWKYQSINVQALPAVSIVFDGGNTWDVLIPYIGLVDSSGNPVYICLGILDDPQNNIIGYNFMAGYEYFFDQGSKVFSWIPSNCTSSINNNTSPQSSLFDSIIKDFAPVSSPTTSPPSSPSSSSTSSSTSSASVATSSSPVILVACLLISFIASRKP